LLIQLGQRKVRRRVSSEHYLAAVFDQPYQGLDITLPHPHDRLLPVRLFTVTPAHLQPLPHNPRVEVQKRLTPLPRALRLPNVFRRGLPSSALTQRLIELAEVVEAHFRSYPLSQDWLSRFALPQVAQQPISDSVRWDRSQLLFDPLQLRSRIC